MIKNILKVLDSVKNDGWLIVNTIIESEELFFVKKELDMNRGKKVNNINVTIYRESEVDGTKFTGSSRTKISPTMNDAEILEALNVASLAASFVKNQYYELVEPREYSFKSSVKEVMINKLVEAVYKNDTCKNGGINSSEFFVEKHTKRVLNSKGVDVSYDIQSCMIEIITDWKEDGEEVELHEIVNFASIDYLDLENRVKDMLEETRLRAIATPLKPVGNVPVILSGTSVKSMVQYFTIRANNQYKYEGYFDSEVGDKLQGEVKSDSLNVTLRPILENSTLSAPCDSDGFILKDINIIKNGELVNRYGTKRYSSYLSLEPTGNIQNIDVQAGTMKESELLKPHIEIIAFSDFQTSPLTGDFGGEIRLARYFDGSKYIPYHGGAITGNMKNIQGNIKLSEELQQLNNFKGPKYIKFEKYSLVTS